MELQTIQSIYPSIKETELFGRYITNSHIEKCLQKHSDFEISTIGKSVEDRPIYAIKFGSGSKKVLMWSQMHGNESTSTKALFDSFNFFKSENPIAQNILETCNFIIIPILNPDGANYYTRLNANKEDLNRDAQNLTQPESLLLRKTYNEFCPDYCFNLHGQRTIFGVNGHKKAATLSFLSPAQDADRKLTKNRKIAMAIIGEINKALQEVLPNSIGRYDDGFNLNCVGDTFQSFGTPTLLFESGHYPNDYNREEVRYFTFLALITALDAICNKQNSLTDYESYLKIPENSKSFYDIIIRNAKLADESELTDIAFQFKETLNDNLIEFIPVVDKISTLKNYFGHKEIDAQGGVVLSSKNQTLKEGLANDFVMLNNEKIVLNNQ